MTQTQENKTLLAVGLLTVALALGINLIVDASALFDGAPLLFLVLLVAGAGLIAWTWASQHRPSAGAPEADGDAALMLPQAHEWALPDLVADPEPAEPVAAEPVAAEAKPDADDLTKIEGIGPVFSKRLIAAGVTTFALLAQKSEDELRGILTEAGTRLIPASISTWAEQAALAAAEDWTGLEALQTTLSGGRRTDESGD